METDFDLLDRWQAGDNASRETLFVRHFDALHGFFRTKTYNEAYYEACELIDKTLLACATAKVRLHKQSSFYTYLFTIARHELCDYLRQQRLKDIDFSVTSMAELMAPPATSRACDTEPGRLTDVLRTMPIEQQVIVELHYRQDMDAAALAEVFEAAPSAMQVRLNLACQALRERLEATGNAEIIGMGRWLMKEYPEDMD